MKEALQCEGCCYLSNGVCKLCDIEVIDSRLKDFYCPLEFRDEEVDNVPNHESRYWLFTNHIVKKVPINILAKECNVEIYMIRKWLNKHKIPIRNYWAG